MTHETRTIGRRALTAAVLTTAAWLTTGPARAAEPDLPSMEVAFDAALDTYACGHWASAFEAFGRLADQGHAQAARIALQMLRHGPRLYGRDFTAPDGAADRWARAALAGRAVGE